MTSSGTPTLSRAAIFAAAAFALASALVASACGSDTKKGTASSSTGQDSSFGVGTASGGFEGSCIFSTSPEGCSGCVSAQCSELLGLADQLCTNFLTCYEGCDCAGACAEACAGLLTGDCGSADTALGDCVTEKCVSECTVTSGTTTTTSTGSSGGTIDEACTTPPSTGVCLVFQDVPASGSDAVAAECNSVSGTLAADCPSAGLVGCCELPPTGAGTSYICYYDAVGQTEADLESSCANEQGTWSTSLP